MVSNTRRAAHQAHRPVLTIEGEAKLIARRPLPRGVPRSAPREAAPTPEWGAAIHAAERAERERRRLRSQRLRRSLGLQTSLAVGVLAALLSVASHSSPVEASYDPITAIIQEDALR